MVVGNQDFEPVGGVRELGQRTKAALNDVLPVAGRHQDADAGVLGLTAGAGSKANSTRQTLKNSAKNSAADSIRNRKGEPTDYVASTKGCCWDRC